MPKKSPNRNQQFKAALALAGMTQAEWRKAYKPDSENGLSETHLREVLEGIRTSEALNAEIDAFIGKYLPRKTYAA